MTFAGLWESRKGPEGEIVESCTASPMILDKKDWDAWLDPDTSKEAQPHVLGMREFNQREDRGTARGPPGLDPADFRLVDTAGLVKSLLTQSIRAARHAQQVS